MSWPTRNAKNTKDKNSLRSMRSFAAIVFLKLPRGNDLYFFTKLLLLGNADVTGARYRLGGLFYCFVGALLSRPSIMEKRVNINNLRGSFGSIIVCTALFALIYSLIISHVFPPSVERTIRSFWALFAAHKLFAP